MIFLSISSCFLVQMSKDNLLEKQNDIRCLALSCYLKVSGHRTLSYKILSIDSLNFVQFLIKQELMFHLK